MTLISHFPLPSMPFQTHDNIVFEKADKDRSSRNNEEFKPEKPNLVTPDTPVEDLKLVNQMYAYNFLFVGVGDLLISGHYKVYYLSIRLT